MNTAQSGDTIDFQVSGTVQLTKALPDISKNITIDGSGQNVTIKGSGNANNPFRIFTVDTNVTATIKNLWIENGYDSSSVGGGVLNDGNLTMYGDSIEGNTTTGNGGGIYNGGDSQLSLQSVTITGNGAKESGGGLFNIGGTVTICCNSNIVSNTSAQGGGGIFTQGLGTSVGKVTCHDSTQISGNSDTGSNGGGVMVGQYGNFIMYGGTIANNYEDSGKGGGLFNDNNGTIDLESGVTIQNNTAFNSGGGMYLANGSTTTLDQVTVQQNKLTLIGGKGVGIYWQNGGKLTYSNLTDKDDPQGKPVQGV